MSSITLHNLNDELDRKIRELAKEKKQSINKTIKDLLMETLGMGKQVISHREEFLDLFGVWSDEDKRKFEKSIADLQQINPEDWK